MCAMQAVENFNSDIEPRCRLCLQWVEIDDGLEHFKDIFAENDSLSFKIRECVGVFISPEDTIRTICNNCQQTVCFIDDFRTLCRQTEEIYESVRICSEDENRWDRYKEYVEELRLMVQQHRDIINEHMVEYEEAELVEPDDITLSSAFVPMTEVKEELECDAEEEPETIDEEYLDSITADVELKQEENQKEHVEDDEEEQESADEDMSAYEFKRRIPVNLKLAIAEEIKSYPVIWDTSLASSAKTMEKAWKEVATNFDMDEKTIKTHWRNLRCFYRINHNKMAQLDKQQRKLIEIIRYIRERGNKDEDAEGSDQEQNASVGEEEAVKIAECGDNDEEEEGEEISNSRSRKSSNTSLTTASKRMQLAKMVYEHEHIWNRRHKDFGSMFLKDQSWDTIAKKLKVTREDVKRGWKCLRDLYRGRMKRVIRGELPHDARIVQDPLFKLLDIMFANNMRVAGTSTVSINSLAQKDSESNNGEDSMANSFNHDFTDNNESDQELESKIEIKQESLSSSSPSTTTSYDLQVIFAQEVLKLLNECAKIEGNTSAYLWKKAGNRLKLGPAVAKSRWNVMKQNYMDDRQRITTGGVVTRLRLQSCALFNLMNQIVPKLDRLAPCILEDEPTPDRKKLPIGLKVAIAQEIRKNPELWDVSLASSSHTVGEIWQKIASKFEMDVETIRIHWGSLQGLYRAHCRQEKNGARIRAIEDKKYCKLIEILRSIRNQTDANQEATSREEIEKQETDEESDTEVRPITFKNKVVKCSKAMLNRERKMKLALFVRKHEFLWNQRHAEFSNLVLKDQTWDVIAESMKVTRDEIKYVWKSLRDVYRCRMKRVLSGKVSSSVYLQKDPLFKLLDEMCANNMKFGSYSSNIIEKHAADVKSEFHDATDENEDEFSVKFDRATKLKLISLVEQNEIIWDSSNPEHNNLEKRDLLWDTIAEQMNISKATVKALWTRLRNLYRGRTLRLLKGLTHKNSPILREPVYLKLHALLDGHMQLGKYTAIIKPPKKPALSRTLNPVENDTATETGPFRTIDDKVRLVQEVIKHELLWNSSHADYFKSEMRGAAWNQIASMFENCEAQDVKSMWRRLRNMHRPRKSRGAFRQIEEKYKYDDDEEHSSPNDPLYELFSKMAQSLTGDAIIDDQNEDGADGPKVGKRRLQEVTEAYMTHKRRYSGKKFFDDEGCIKVTKGGTVRYEKICELCGKQVERSMFEYHMNQHNGIKPYVCSFEGCGRQYSNKITRDRHEVLIHEDNYKYNCDQCDEKFKYRSTFDYHYAMKHKSQMVPCPICNKLLKHKSLVREHVRRHSGNFPCPVCGKILQKKYSLDIHMRTHTNEKPYLCDLCDKRFMLKVQKKTHLEKVHQMSWQEYVASFGDNIAQV